MSASQSGVYNTQQFTDMGAPLVGGRLYTYAFGTTTHKTAFTDHAGAIPHTYSVDSGGGQFIALDARGELPAPLYLTGGSYDLALKTAAGATIWTRQADPIQDIATAALALLADPSGSVLLGHTQGAGKKTTTVQATLRQYVVFNDYNGADGTGATSSSPAFDAAMLDAAGDVVFKGGIWRIDQNLALKSGKKFIAENGAVILRNDTSQIIGSSPSLVEITAAADMDYGDNKITLDAGSYASVAVGGYLYLKDRTAINSDYVLDYFNATTSDLCDPSKWIYQVQVFKIVAKLGSNAVRVNATADTPFPLMTTGKIYKVAGDVIEDVGFEGFEFRNGPGLTGVTSESAFFNASYVYGLNISHSKFSLGGQTGGIYAQAGRLKVFHSEFEEAKFLAVFLRQAVPNSRVTHCEFKNQTSGDASVFVEASNYNISISNNGFDGSMAFESANEAQLISAVQMDAKVRGVTVNANNVNGYGVGFRLEMGCMSNTVTGNTARNCAIAGVRLNQSAQNTLTGNTFYNCGTAAAPGTLANAVGAITAFSSSRNTISANTISNDSQHVRPAMLVNGNSNVINDNIFVNAGQVLITGSRNKFKGNTGDFAVSDQIVRVSGTTSHYNDVDDNTLTSLIPCIYAVRLDAGSECNTVTRTKSVGCDYVVGLTGTSNAQSLSENTRLDADVSTPSNIYNVDISAPVMPTNAVMPRRFRIHSTTTTFGVGSLAPQGASTWEFALLVGGVGNRFNKFSPTMTTVDI